MPYLYGQLDTKFIKRSESEGKKKLKPLEAYKFKLSPLLEGKWKLRRGEAAIRYRTTPDTLVELCSTKVNAAELPRPQNWSINDVADWIRNLGFPQYQNTFKKNLINGRVLLRMDASYLVQINIKDFTHIQCITNSIRNMYAFDRAHFGRTISLPERDPGAAYTFFRTSTGASYESTRRTDLFRKRHILQSKPLYETHWQTLERWIKHHRPLEKVLLGGALKKRNPLYTLKKGKLQSTSSKPDYSKYSDCIPPCTCQWTAEKDLRQPWQLKCLKKPTLSRCAPPCVCTTPCVCGWGKTPSESLSILRKNLPNRYDVRNKDRLGRSGCKIYLGEVLCKESQLDEICENCVY